MPPTTHAIRDSHSASDNYSARDSQSTEPREPLEPSGASGSIPLFQAGDIPAFFARDAAGDPAPEEAAPDEFTVRPAYPLHGFLAGGAGLLALGFAVAASRAGGVAAGWRWALALGFAILAGTAVRALLAKPLLVADGTGIRLRIRRDWIGAPWEEIESVTVLPRRHVLDDGRIAVHLADPGPVVAAIARDTSRATRNLTDANRRLTGSSLAVPFGLAAAPSHPSVVTALTALADDRCPVTEQA